jgi:hypothetical protein
MEGDQIHPHILVTYSTHFLLNYFIFKFILYVCRGVQQEGTFDVLKRLHIC